MCKYGWLSVRLWYFHWYRSGVTKILHYDDVIMGAIASQITSLIIVYSIFYSDADQRKHQSSPSMAFVRGIHRGPVNSPHKWPVTRKMFPCDDVIMALSHRNTFIRSGVVSCGWWQDSYASWAVCSVNVELRWLWCQNRFWEVSWSFP